MNFIICLCEPLNDSMRIYLKEIGYTISFEDKILPKSVIVSKEDGNIQELESIEFIKDVTNERIFTVDSEFK